MDFSVQINTLWVLLGAFLIFLMQAGFALVESGFTRTKNAGSVTMKNLVSFACSCFVFWVIGYGLMYGAPSGGFVGRLDLFTTGTYDTGALPKWAHVVLLAMCCATAATIISGAMAERIKFKAHLIYSMVFAALVFPIAGNWVWGGGWLSTLTAGKASGFIDGSGSAVIHMVGGLSALVGAKLIGPRAGKYAEDGQIRAIPGHSITLGGLGVFILWFGWFGFSAVTGKRFATPEGAYEAAGVFMAMNLSGVAATLVTMFFTWIRYKKTDVSMTLNGALAGLVSVSAGAAVMEPWAAALTGILSGLLVVYGIEFVEKKLRVDDPVGVIGVHGINGAFGAIACGLFSRETGVFTTGDGGQLLIQLAGIAGLAVWVLVTMTLVFKLLDKMVGLRVPLSDEILGLDSAEHGISGEYTEHHPLGHIASYADFAEESKKGPVPIEEAVPIQLKESLRPKVNGAKLTKVEILTKQSRFEALKKAMNEIGVTGMTVTQVLGCGMQKGSTEYYRSVPVDIQLLPKIQVEIVVAKVPVSKVIETAKEILYTGHIGDGKIFVYDVENVIKVRTGEEGYNALQGIDD